MRYLRQNTAIRITVGPFLDKTDGITPKTALTVTSCHLTLMVDTGDVPTLVLDANATASGGNNDMVHVTNDDAGFYDLELTAAQLNYVGRAMLSINDVATHCPVFHEFQVLTALVYDSLIVGTDNLQVEAVQITAGQITVKKNTQLTAFPFVMRDSTTHAPQAGLAVTATRSLDGAAFAGCANAVTEIASGWYKITLAAADLNANTIALRFTAAAADDLDITILTQS